MLRKEPGAITHWTTTQQINVSRRVLDAKKSDSAPSFDGKHSLAEVQDGWERLADIFNDYKNFTPQNEMICYANGSDGIPIPKVPKAASDEKYTVLFQFEKYTAADEKEPMIQQIKSAAQPVMENTESRITVKTANSTDLDRKTPPTPGVDIK